MLQAQRRFGRTFQTWKLAAKKASGILSARTKKLPVFISRAARPRSLPNVKTTCSMDRMVAFHVLRGVTVPLSAAEFTEGLAQRFPERERDVFLA